MPTKSYPKAHFHFYPNFFEVAVEVEGKSVTVDGETLLRFVDEHRPQPAEATPPRNAPPSSALVEGPDGAFYNAHDLQWFERSGFSDDTGDCLLRWRLRGWDCEHRWCGPEAEADAFVSRMLTVRGEVEATETSDLARGQPSTSEATLTSKDAKPYTLLGEPLQVSFDDSSAPAPADCKSHDGTAWGALSDVERGALTRALPPGDEAASAELNALLEDSHRLAALQIRQRLADKDERLASAKRYQKRNKLSGDNS